MQHAKGRNGIKNGRCNAQKGGGMDLSNGYGGLIVY
jgi:hypothetical protein